MPRITKRISCVGRSSLMFAQLVLLLSASLAAAADKGLQPGKPSDVGMDAGPVGEIAQRMQEYVEQQKLAGVVTLVARQGRIVHLEAAGQADLENKLPMRKDTIFGIASMTKPITGAAVMVLVDEGKLSLDDPVSKYIPAFKDAALASGAPQREITLRDVVTHTSGVIGDQQNMGTLKETGEKLAQRKLGFEPGSKWQYSPGLSVAGRCVEVASGKPFDVFLRERFFEPLKMVDTSFHPTPEQQRRLAKIYKPSEGKKASAKTDKEEFGEIVSALRADAKTDKTIEGKKLSEHLSKLAAGDEKLLVDAVKAEANVHAVRKKHIPGYDPFAAPGEISKQMKEANLSSAQRTEMGNATIAATKPFSAFRRLVKAYKSSLDPKNARELDIEMTKLTKYLGARSLIGKMSLERTTSWITDLSEGRTPNPSGGLFSTATDVARFYQMALGGGELDGRRILSEKAVKEMTSIQTGELKVGFTDGNGWGIGCCVVRKPQGPTEMLSPGTFGHGGAFGTQSWADPKQQMIFVLMIQRAGLVNGDASEFRVTLQDLAVKAVRP